MHAAAGPLVLAEHHLARGRPDRALAALAKVTGPELETYEFWALRAIALYRLHGWEEAIEAAREGLAHEPNDFHLLEVLALAQSELKNKGEAVEAIETAISLHPQEAVLHAHKALILARNAQNAIGFASYRKARAAAEDALRLDPHCVAALKVRAHVALLSGERPAQKFAARVLSLDPENEQAHVLVGSALAHRGRVTAGLDHYLEAARLDPKNSEAARLADRTQALRHPAAFVLRIFLRAGPLPVLLTILVLVIVFELTGLETPLAIIGILFLAFFYYLLFSGAVLHGKGQRRSR